MPSWTVVEFLPSGKENESSVEAVPTKWLRGKQCFWPSTSIRKNVLTEIRKCVEPDEDWNLYDVRLFKDGTFDDYDIARKKVKRAEVTSDLNSEVDDSNKRKRFKKSLDLYSSDSDSSETTHKRKIHSPPNLRSEFENSISLLHSFEDDSRAELEQRQINSLIGSLEPEFNMRNEEVTVLNTRSPKTHLNSNSATRLQDFVGKSYAGSSSSVNGAQGSKQSCSGCRALEGKMDQIMNDTKKRFNSIKSNLLQIREDIQLILNNQRTEVETSDGNTFLKFFDFPLRNETDLIHVNNYLAIDENFNLAVKNLVSLGGNTPYDFVRRCFQELMPDILAKNFTFDGTKTKAALKEMKIGSLFVEACQRQSNIDKKSAEKEIRKWLRRAKERFEMKQVRSQRTMQL